MIFDCARFIGRADLPCQFVNLVARARLMKWSPSSESKTETLAGSEDLTLTVGAHSLPTCQLL